MSRTGIPKSEHRQNLLEQTAKLAYSAYLAHVRGPYEQPAWERLEDFQRTAWKEVVEFLEDEPDCPDCGEPMVCIDCDSDQTNRWNLFTPEERSTLDGALRDSSGMRSSGPWYARCTELRAEITKFQQENVE